MKKAICTALLALSASTAANANLITNGSFEDTTGVLKINAGSWKVFDNISGWDTVSGPGIEVQTNRTLRNIDAQDGYNYVELDSHGARNTNSAMSQLLTGLTIGATYELDFFYHARTNKRGNDNGISVFWDAFSGPSLESFSYTDKALSIENVNYNDTVINGATAVNGGWFKFSLDLVATSDSMALTFGADGKDNSLGGLIDNVSMYSVPEPGTLGLFALGVAGLLVLRKR